MSLALVALPLITGCSSTKPKGPDEPPEVLYQKARIKLDTGTTQCHRTAGSAGLSLPVRCLLQPGSAHDLIHAYYKQDDTAQAIASIDRFIRPNPAHKNIDYVFYMRGLTNMAADYNFFQGFPRHQSG